MRRKSNSSLCCNPDNDSYMEDKDLMYDDPMDIIISSLSELNVKDTCLNIKEKACNTICELCKEYSNQKVSNICPSNCIYFCHEKCFIKWIIDRRDFPFCMKCKLPYSIEMINRIFFHANRLNQIYR